MASFSELLKGNSAQRLQNVRKQAVFSYCKPRRGYKLITDIRECDIDKSFSTFVWDKEYIFSWATVKEKPHLFWWQKI